MQTRFLIRVRTALSIAAAWLLTSAAWTAGAEADVSKSQRRQALLAGEVLFHAYQNDYFSAITQLRLAHDRGLLPATTLDWDFLLTRLKLGYGLHEEARVALPDHLSPEVPDPVRNRTWYELAKALFNRDYPEAAIEALENVQGKVPEDMVGDYQLLHAHVLMALQRYSEAASVLRKWKGPEALVGYAYYNRGIALLRAGDEPGAIESLNRVVRIRSEADEFLALKDKANLTLGYVFLRAENLERARDYLQQVRRDSPYSNRALLALGWIAQEQGRGQDALDSWVELRTRTSTDPAVQESLLAVPYAHRELRSLKAAAQHYEEAVATFSQELNWLDDALESVQNPESFNVLLLEDPKPSPGAATRLSGDAPDPESRYLGPLLASRTFLETSRGHRELRAMLEDLDKGLRSIDALEKRASEPATPERETAADARSGQTGRDSTGPVDRPEADEDAVRVTAPNEPGWTVEWETLQRAGRSSPELPELPELELPAEGAITPLPGSELKGLPESEVIGLPESEVIGLPESEIIGFPESEWLSLPDTGRFQFPNPDYEDFPYPDALARKGEPDGTSQRFPRRFAVPGSNAGGELTSKALEELASAVGHATERMGRVVGALGRNEARKEGVGERLAALRQRLLALRDRVAAAIALHESYASALATEELKRRHVQIEQYLEQARLELAKTYDLATER